MLTQREGSICFLALPGHFCLFNSLLPVFLVNFIELISLTIPGKFKFISIWVSVLSSPCSDSMYHMERKGGKGLIENGIHSCHIMISFPGVEEIKGYSLMIGGRGWFMGKSVLIKACPASAASCCTVEGQCCGTA